MNNNLKYSRILIAGSIAFDEIMNFPGKFVDYLKPEKLHQISVSFNVDRLEKQIGGIAVNIAYNLSFITKKKIIPLGAVGKDGKELVEFLKRNDISTEGVLLDKILYTSTGKVITDVNDNQIWGFYYGAAVKGKELILHKYTDNNTLLILSATHPDAFLALQKQAISMKLDYMYDPGPLISSIQQKDLEDGIKHSKWIIGNDYETAQIERVLGKKLSEFLPIGVSVITTLGAKGVQYKEQKNTYHSKAYKLNKIVDPTGAGDAWRAGFVAAISDKKSIEDSLKMGNVMASFAIEHYGTVNHKPRKAEILRRLKSL